MCQFFNKDLTSKNGHGLNYPKGVLIRDGVNYGKFAIVQNGMECLFMLISENSLVIKP